MKIICAEDNPGRTTACYFTNQTSVSSSLVNKLKKLMNRFFEFVYNN